jgi:hypothetical protein
LLTIPSGNNGQVKVEGYQPIPTGMQEILKSQGVSGTYSQPKEKTYETIDATTSAAIKNQYGIDLPAGTPRAIATTAISLKQKQDIADKKNATPTELVTTPFEPANPELLAQYVVPEKRPNPYRKMTEQTYKTVKAANTRTANLELAKAQTMSDNATESNAQLMRAKSLIEGGLGTGVGTKLTGKQFFGKGAEFQQIASKLLPSMRNGMPGAVSDRDVAIFKEANIDLNKPEEVNLKVLNQSLAVNKRIADKARFLSNYSTVYGDLQGATAEWNKYINSVPLFSPKGEVMPYKSFEEFFSAPKAQTKEVGVSQPKNEFSDAEFFAFMKGKK